MYPAQIILRPGCKRSDSVPSSVALGTGGWHNVEMCGTVGSAGTWGLYRDGVQVLTGWTANTGTTAIGRLEIGDSTGSKTWSVNYDVVVVDQVPGPVI